VSEPAGSVVPVLSRDGTPIASHRTGTGPPLVLVHGTAAAHWSFRFVAPLLAEHFTLYAVDRRGRGASGDGGDYAIEREFEDVAAVVDSLGGPASLFGHSFGATVALGAALLARRLSRLVLYEPAPGVPAVSDAELDRIEVLVGRGEREDALVAAFRSFGLAPDEVEQLRGSPTWATRLGFAHTVVREVRAEAACGFEASALRGLAAPVLLLLGEESPPWAHERTAWLQKRLADCRIATLRGQGHVATMTAPELVAGELVAFLGEPSA
jgi:pimeloyl-ACP methyl ester carboxylesterase